MTIFMMRYLIIGFGIAILDAGCQSTCAADISQGQAAPAVKRVVVWDGEQASTGAGWTNPTTATIKPQTVEAHSGNTAIEFKFQGSGEEWLGAGWNWCAFQTGPYGTDITTFKNFTFWMKTKGKVTEPQINLLCNGAVFDTPEHHTEKVPVLKYCPQLLDGQWHQVSIPLADLKQPKGFDPSHVGELQMFNAGEGDGSFFIDDIGFEGPADAMPAAAPVISLPAQAPRSTDNWIFSNGFEDNIPGTGDWQKTWGSPWGELSRPDGAGVSTLAIEGSRSLRVKYPKGGVGPQQTGIQWPTVVANTDGYEELYLRYYVYFENGFDFKIGGKLPGLMSLGHPTIGGYVPDGSNAWLMRFMWRENGKAEVYSMLPPSKFNNFKYSYDVQLEFAFSTGKWYCIEQYIKLNSVGNDNGKLKAWIDGANLLDRSDVLYRTVDNRNVKIGGFYFSTFHGGDTMAWAPSVDSYARFDAVVLSKERIGCIDSEPASPDVTSAVRSPAEMLINGSFADGNAHWVVEESGATGQAECVKEGPDGKAALRLRVLTIGDNTWRLQIYQTGMRVEKGKTYVMTFWAKSDCDGNITVNCMRNHEPWDHHTQEKMPVSTEWKQMRFTFVAPWDDNNVRISFTDLGTEPGQIYWFADCSLVPAP
jgi:hypothetical protein